LKFRPIEPANKSKKKDMRKKKEKFQNAVSSMSALDVEACTETGRDVLKKAKRERNVHTN